MRAVITVTHKNENDLSIKEYWDIFRKMKIKPSNLPNINEDDADYESKLINFFKEQSKEILEKIPHDNLSDKTKVEKEKEGTIYFSHLTSSDTDFMVVMRNNGELLFRLTNVRIEKLQQGCIDLVKIIEEYNKKNGSNINVNPEIDVFEHGLNDSTITGEIINRGKLGRLIYIYKNDTKEIIVILGSIILLLISLLIGINYKSLEELYQFMGRLETGFITTIFISFLTLLYSYLRTVPVIKWTLKIKKK
jgi:uncharacterized integral membrane protein